MSWISPIGRFSADYHWPVLGDSRGLPFPILCDTERSVVKEWNVFNERERGGIAKPSVFVIDPGRVVRYSSVDTVAGRVPAEEIVRFLRMPRDAKPVRRRLHFPRLLDWMKAIRNGIRG